MDLKEVRAERTDWRDYKLDNLLIQSGIGQTTSFLVTEYNYGISVAIIEYKRVGSSIMADQRLVKYCQKRKNKEPYYIILYDYELVGKKCRITKFIIYPKNAAAVLQFGLTEKTMTELEFIDFLYQIRENFDSIYRKKAHQEYTEWFELNKTKTFGLDKRVISVRHRSYQHDVPAADIDSMVCDQSNNPYLFVEYKENSNYGKAWNDGHNEFIYKNMSQTSRCLLVDKVAALQNKAIADLGDGCKVPIPVLAVEYNLKYDVFSLYAFNNCAKEIVQLGIMKREEYLKYIRNPKNFKIMNKDDLKIEDEHLCLKCGKQMKLRQGKFGKFYGCSAFLINNCRYTEKYQEKNKVEND